MKFELLTSENIVLILTAITAIAAAFSAIGAWLSARATKLTSEAQLFSRFMEEYGAYEMVTALRNLRNWKAENGDEFEEKWRKALDNSESQAHEVDKSRRLVKFYFLKALRLYTSGFVSKKFLKQVISVDGINILFEIVEPLEYALNPAYNKSNFKKLKTLCKSKGTGRLIRPVPVVNTENRIS